MAPGGGPNPSFPPTRPGQFVQLSCRPPDSAAAENDLIGQAHAWEAGQRPALRQPELCAPLALLRRPFSLAGRGDDDNGTWLELVHRVVGVGTDWLAHLAVGSLVPLGQAHSEAKQTETTDVQSK